MSEFVNKGIQLEYQVTGRGMPLVFLHGLGGSIRQIESVYERIDGVQLITLNQQGHGGSKACWDTLDFDQMGDDVAALLKYLGIENAYFAGISMGAAVSLNVAVRYPGYVKKMLLIRNAWTDRPMSPEVQQAYRDMGLALKKGRIEAFCHTRGWEIVEKSSAYTKNAFLSPFKDPASIENWQKFLILPGKAPVARTASLRSIEIPVTILANRNDLCHPYVYGEYLHEQIPRSVLTEIPDKDTDSVTHRQMINQAVRDMVASL